MRAKQILEQVPVMSKLKLAWEKLTLSRLTIAYFIFSLLHCTIQTGFQIRAFTINADAASFLFDIAEAGHATDLRIPALNDQEFRLCKEVPVNPNDISHCDLIWDGSKGKNWVGDAPASASTPEAQSITVIESRTPVATSTAVVTSQTVSVSTSVTVVPITSAASVVIPVAVPTPAAPGSILASDSDSDDDEDDDEDDGVDDDFGVERTLLRRTGFKVLVGVDGMTQINVTGNGYDNTPVTLSKSCLWALNWPVSVLENTKREDIVFIAFQFWVLGMSLVALMNESIPHIFASLLTHVLATVWSAFQIAHTNKFRADFNRMITRGACNGIPLLGSYWEDRQRAEYPALALNIVSLLISAFLTWKLVKLFGWQTFKRVGASLVMNRIYKLVLSLSISLQLGFFFMGAAVALWLDNLYNGIAGNVASYVILYKATSFTTLFLLVPWLMSGWIAIRHEKRLGTFIFLALSLLYLGAWAVMLLADTFRWLFVTWIFFSIMASISIFLTVVTFVLGVICRYNFGKGLPKYLNAQEPLPGDDFAPVYGNDVEKFAFPSQEKPIPTFSGSFGKGADAVLPSQMFSAQQMGPRFYNPSAEPFEQPHVATPPQAATLTRASSKASSNTGSIHSYYSYSSHSHSDSVDSRGKRWLIE